MLPALNGLGQEKGSDSSHELNQLNRALNELFQPKPDGPGKEGVQDPTPGDVHDQIRDLQVTLEQLQEILDEKLLAIADLEDENLQLRQALRLRYGRSSGSLPAVPMPHRELIDAVLNEPLADPAQEGPAEPQTDPREPYRIVSRWGRSPEVAASMRGSVSSLIGLAITVPPDTPQTQLRRLAKELRAEYAEYDNINIEAFDDAEAAKRYAQLGEADTRHRVLSISKFRHSERDVILLYDGDRPIEVR